MKKKSQFEKTPPTVDELGKEKANALIRELWDRLREYEDKLAQSSKNSSKSPSSDPPEVKAERKKLKRLVAEIKLALSQVTPDTGDH